MAAAAAGAADAAAGAADAAAAAAAGRPGLVPVWIVAYPASSLRQRLGGGSGARARLKLPAVDQLLSLHSRHSQTLLNGDSVRAITHGPCVSGLAFVCKGNPGPVPLNFEEEVFCDYFQASGFTVKIHFFARVPQDAPPVPVHLVRMQPEAPATLWGKPRLAVSLMAHDFADLQLETYAGQPRSAQEILDDWGYQGDADAIRVVPVVEQLAYLMELSLWKHVFIPSIWALPKRALHPSWVGYWPPRDYLLAPGGLAEGPAKLLDSLHVANDVLADILLAHGDGLNEEIEMDLQVALLCVQSVKHRFQPGWSGQDHYKHGKLWTGTALLATGLITYECGHGSFEYIAGEIAGAFAWDIDSRKCLLEASRQRRGGHCLAPRGRATQNWAQQLVDVAFMLEWRKTFSDSVGKVSLYWFADSSPQKGYDWLNTSYILVLALCESCSFCECGCLKINLCL